MYITPEMKFGKLHAKESHEVSSGSKKKIWWLCDCGKEKLIQIISVLSGRTASCGRCNLITAEEILKRTFDKLRIKDSQDVLPGSNKKVWWLCNCGKEILASPYGVLSGHTTSCGKCNLITAEEISKMKFGKLRVKYSQDILPWSHKKVWWLCDCGSEKLIQICKVTQGNTISCGNCYNVVQNYYLINKEKIRSLKCPVSLSDFPVGSLASLEIILKSNNPFKARCSMCGSVYYPRLNDIKRGVSLTCGCVSYRISNAQKEITDFIKSFNLEVINEYEVNGLKYDIFVPFHNLLIEYNGLKWHSYLKSKIRDVEKYINSSNYNYLMVFEDEWVHNQSKVKSLIMNRLGVIKSQSIRSNKCEIKFIVSNEVNLFYDQFHYIGKCHPKISYGVYYLNKLIAAISFSHPTRQTSKYQYELARMASDPGFHVHGIWSKLLKKFIKENNPSSIVTFSDNRLFSGQVYEKIGFKFDGEIKPDYYWVKNQKRFHKSGLRKTKEEILTGLTETQLRESQGYKKIWDLGKKRWVLNMVN